jgi:hypothetical protein
MSAKSYAPRKLNDATSTAATFNSNVVNLEVFDNICLQLIWTGTTAGAFAVQVCQDYDPTNTSSGTWVSMTLPSTPTAAGSADSAIVDLNQIGACWLRVVFTRTSGTGTATIWYSMKAV